MIKFSRRWWWLYHASGASLGSLGPLQAEGCFLGQREPLVRLICQAGGTVRLAGEAFLAKMKLGSGGCGWNPMLTFQIPSASEC